MTYNVGCTATSAVLSYTGPTTFSYAITPGSVPQVNIPKFSTTEPNCPITYTMTPSAGNTYMDTTVYNTNIAGDNLVKIAAGRNMVIH